MSYVQTIIQTHFSEDGSLLTSNKKINDDDNDNITQVTTL